MEDLRDPTSSEKTLFFNRKRYLQYIETLMNEIMVYQDTFVLPQKEPKPLENPTIQSASLNCEHHQLFIKLIGTNGTYIDKILIHKFNDDSSPRKFFEGLINKGERAVFNCEEGGGTISKHILEVKIPKVFVDLFILKISKYKASLKSNPIILSEISRDEADQVFKEIDRLRVKNQKVSKKKSKPRRTSK